jgi:phosphonopyruvate decarboxylase
MIRVATIYNILTKNGTDFFTGVPDSLLKDFCAYIQDNTPKEKNIIASNEGAAIAIATGHYLATESTPLVYMQNSGIGNAVNPLLSLADEKVYKIPMLLVIGWRGEPNTKDEPQHKKQGEVMLDMLSAMKIPYSIIETDEQIATKQFEELLSNIKVNGYPHAAVIRKDTFSAYTLKSKIENNFEMSREYALQTVINSLKEKDVTISTTGKLSRELFEYREKTNAGHSNDFLTVGSMGHSSSIALGVALNKPDRNVYCLDGDGALIMHTGAMATTGALKPKNYKHIVFNNGSHESVGGQPTVAFGMDLPQTALSCGYKTALSVSTQKDLESVLLEFGNMPSPAFLEIKVNTKSRADLGRPTTTTYENKEQFISNLLS